MQMTIIMFVAGWIAGVVGTLFFGKLISERLDRDDERTGDHP